MKNTLGKAAILVSFAGLVGCVSEAQVPKPVDKFEADKVAFTQSSDVQLCEADQKLDVTLSENPSISPEAKNRRIRYELLRKEIDLRHINCHKIRAVNAPPVKPLSPQEKKHRAALSCRAIAERSRYSDPSVVFEMCAQGFHSSTEKCRSNLEGFSREMKTIPLSGRAEWSEISTAFRQGCNLR